MKEKISIAFFDTKPYDKIWFERLKKDYDIKYFETKLNEQTASLANGCRGAVAFVNDTIDSKVIDIFYENDVEVIAMRCAGYNNIDFKDSFGKVHVVRVPAYSPYAVAEYAVALLLTLNRKIHKAYNRTREHNFNIDALNGFDLFGKTIGVVGTGKIGRIFIDICKGFNMKILAYDPYPAKIEGVEFVSFEKLCRKSNIISLHCPLNSDTNHIINQKAIDNMKEGVVIINTSRGALIDSNALLAGLKLGKIGGAAVDVYEEESELFFEDFSNSIIHDDVLTMLISLPNVIVTSHQAFLTDEALKNIAQTTIDNLDEYFNDKPLTNEICYECLSSATCESKQKPKRCF